MTDKLKPVDVGRAVDGELAVDDIPNATVDVLLERNNGVRNVPIEEMVSTALVRENTKETVKQSVYQQLSAWVVNNLSTGSYAKCDIDQVFGDLQGVCDKAVEVAFAIESERVHAEKRNELRSEKPLKTVSNATA